MIQSINQLRIGNLINENNSFHGIQQIEVDSIWTGSNNDNLINVSQDANGYGHVSMNGIKISDCFGIFLTEEWLIKFGFKEKKICIMSDIARTWHEEQRKGSSLDNAYGLNGYYIVPRIGMRLNIGHINNSLNMDGCTINDIELKFVHQLQNLYYCLTGLELEIKK